MISWIISPVLLYECVRSARRWQTYASRIGFLCALLISLVVVSYRSDEPRADRNALAAIGQAFFLGVSATLLGVALLVAPAYTAASICLDKARGALTHILVTELSATEIIVGKLVSRGALLFGLILAGMPVLVLATLLGGIAPEAAVGCAAVTLAAALLACALALALSVWGTKPHEVLLGAYFLEALWLLAWPVWSQFAAARLVGAPPEWIKRTNPFFLLFAPYLWPDEFSLKDYAAFIGTSIGLTTILVLVAILTLRRSALADGNRRTSRWRWPQLLPFAPSLDLNPVLWREWRRTLPSRWLKAVWALFALGSVTECVLAYGTHAFGVESVIAWVFSVGLLLMFVTAVASIFEERVNGSIEVLLATPLSAASIYWGKWLANFRMLPIAMLPVSILGRGSGELGAWALLTAIPFTLGLLCMRRSPVLGVFMLLLTIWPAHGLARSYCQVFYDWKSVPLLGMLMLAYGAFINTTGLAFAVSVKRFGLAMGLAVGAFLLLSIVPLIPMFLNPWRDPPGLAFLSPLHGVKEVSRAVLWGHFHDGETSIKCLQIFVYYTLTISLSTWTILGFDDKMGRAAVRHDSAVTEECAGRQGVWY